MSLDAQFAAWAAAQSDACKRKLLDGTAAVMPVKTVEVIHGAGEAFAPKRPDLIKWAEKALHLRLDAPVAMREVA